MPMVSINRMFQRVNTHKALGLLYNVPEKHLTEMKDIMRRSLRITVDAKEASDRKTLLESIAGYGNYSGRRSIEFMLNYAVSFLKKKMLIIYHADLLGKESLKLLNEFAKEKIPVVLIFNNGGFHEFRKSEVYNTALTIEKDYSALKIKV